SALLPPRHVVLADNETALAAAADAARRLGYDARVLPRHLRGEARERGRELAALAREPVARPAAYLAGGETTVHVAGSGRGGRNQELALAAVDGLSGRDAILAAFGTDGVDGPTDAAGAIVDGMTRARADALGLDAHAHLAENDAHPYFDALSDLIRTGPTGTNVRDVAVLLVRGPSG
ncbi:MAG TPA: MOFRL family protein, partial [Candidatus Thermoplasmatota archaeon]|nr:MOFRL family protein [Candidatus Thermoplasmatota archaeon]